MGVWGDGCGEMGVWGDTHFVCVITCCLCVSRHLVCVCHDILLVCVKACCLCESPHAKTSTFSAATMTSLFQESPNKEGPPL